MRAKTQDDQSGVGIDDDLMVGGVAVVLRPLGDGVVAGGDQGAVHDEHGVLGEPLARLKREHWPEVVDDAAPNLDTPNSGASCRIVRFVPQ